MGWTQEEISHVLAEIKSVAAEVWGSHPNNSADQIKHAVKTKLKYRFGYRDYRGWRLHGSRNSLSDKSYKRFIKSKYYNLGLPSKEIIMTQKLIDAVVDSLDCSTSFDKLNSAIGEVQTATGKAKAINATCGNVVDKLNDICKYLEDEECLEQDL